MEAVINQPSAIHSTSLIQPEWFATLTTGRP
jgi:hypothetical protein